MTYYIKESSHERNAVEKKTIKTIIPHVMSVMSIEMLLLSIGEMRRYRVT